MTTPPERKPTDAELQLARDTYETPTVRIDPDQAVEPLDKGLWVAAWVWVAAPEADSP